MPLQLLIMNYGSLLLTGASYGIQMLWLSTYLIKRLRKLIDLNGRYTYWAAWKELMCIQTSTNAASLFICTQLFEFFEQFFETCWCWIKWYGTYDYNAEQCCTSVPSKEFLFPFSLIRINYKTQKLLSKVNIDVIRKYEYFHHVLLRWRRHLLHKRLKSVSLEGELIFWQPRMTRCQRAGETGVLLSPVTQQPQLDWNSIRVFHQNMRRHALTFFSNSDFGLFIGHVLKCRQLLYLEFSSIVCWGVYTADCHMICLALILCLTKMPL